MIFLFPRWDMLIPGGYLESWKPHCDPNLSKSQHLGWCRISSFCWTAMALKGPSWARQLESNCIWGLKGTFLTRYILEERVMICYFFSKSLQSFWFMFSFARLIFTFYRSKAKEKQKKGRWNKFMSKACAVQKCCKNWSLSDDGPSLKGYRTVEMVTLR